MKAWDPYPWLEGERIHQLGARVVVKCPVKNGGSFVAKKVDGMGGHIEGQANMMRYAIQVAGVKVPRPHRVERHGERIRVLVMNFDDGLPLDRVWPELGPTDKDLLAKELEAQIRRMRCHKMPLIGRVDENGKAESKVTFLDPYRPQIATSCTAFASESEFDAHKVDQLRDRDPDAALKLQQQIKTLRPSYTNKFVLTHGDLSPRNIHVKRSPKNERGASWHISAIFDWERSGFFPEYMEYVQARHNTAHNTEWHDFFVGLLERMNLGCSETRIEVEDLATFHVL